MKVRSTSISAPTPVEDDDLDAVEVILANLRDWAHSLAPGRPRFRHTRTATLTPESTAELAADYARAILVQLEWVCTHVRLVLDLAEAIVVIHPVVDGVQQAWSLADARARWGAQSQDRHFYPDDEVEADGVVSRTPVREWHDPLLVSKDAAKRAGVTESQLRKWVTAGVLVPSARLRDPRGVVTRWYHASAVDAAAALMRARRHAGVAPTSE